MATGPNVVLTEYKYSLQGGGYGLPDDPDSIGARFVKTLDKLNHINPSFSNWLLTDRVTLKQVKLADVRGRIGVLVEKNARSDGFERPDPSEGFFMRAANASVAGPGGASFLVVTEPRDKAHMFEMQFGWDQQGVDASLITYPLFKATLLSILADWPSAWAMATGFKSKLRHVPDGPAIRVETESFHRLTWLAYLPEERTADLDLPAGLITERTPDGGLLMIVDRARPESSNVAQMQRADRLTEIMTKRWQPHR